jgi:hypothetical protein
MHSRLSGGRGGLIAVGGESGMRFAAPMSVLLA